MRSSIRSAMGAREVAQERQRSNVEWQRHARLPRQDNDVRLGPGSNTAWPNNPARRNGSDGQPRDTQLAIQRRCGDGRAPARSAQRAPKLLRLQSVPSLSVGIQPPSEYKPAAVCSVAQRDRATLLSFVFLFIQFARVSASSAGAAGKRLGRTRHRVGPRWGRSTGRFCPFSSTRRGDRRMCLPCILPLFGCSNHWCRQH